MVNFTGIHNQLAKMKRRYVVEGAFSKEDYDEFRTEMEAQIHQIQSELRKNGFEKSNLDKAIDAALQYALNISDLWKKGDIQVKRILQKLVFPDGIMYDFENDHYRTARINNFWMVGSSLPDDNGKHKKRDNSCCPLLVPKVGVEPTRPNGHMALNHACLPIPALGLKAPIKIRRGKYNV